MPYKGEEKNLVRTFFSSSSKDLKKELQCFADSKRCLPTVHEFIDIIGIFIERGGAEQVSADVINIMSIIRMRDDVDLIKSYMDTLTDKITVPPAPSAPPPAAPQIVLKDGSILADNSASAKSAVKSKTSLSDSDAAACINAYGATGNLKGDTSVGTYYHKTVHSSSSSYGVKDTDGIHKMTCLYVAKKGAYYFVGIAMHDGTESIGGKSVVKYRVQLSLISNLRTGDTLHFI